MVPGTQPDGGESRGSLTQQRPELGSYQQRRGRCCNWCHPAQNGKRGGFWLMALDCQHGGPQEGKGWMLCSSHARGLLRHCPGFDSGLGHWRRGPGWRPAPGRR